MQIVVHAGMHKTGTTSFQKALAGHADELASKGIFAVIPGRHLSTSPLGFAEGAISELIGSAASKGSETVVVSHEAISLFEPAGLARLRAEIGPHPVKFVIVLRHWCSYLPSRWAQNSRRRDGISFVRFLDHVGSDRHWMRFDRILTNARDAGFDEILPISFDAAKGGLIDALSTACGIGSLPKSQTLNRATSLMATEKVRLFNAARAKMQGLPADAMLMRLEKSTPMRPLFDQQGAVAAILEEMPDLDRDLEERLTASQRDISLLPEQFDAMTRTLESVAGKSLFADIAPHNGRYSTLEFDGLESRLRDRIQAGLRQAEPGWFAGLARATHMRLRSALKRLS